MTSSQKANQIISELVIIPQLGHLVAASCRRQLHHWVGNRTSEQALDVDGEEPVEVRSDIYKSIYKQICQSNVLCGHVIMSLELGIPGIALHSS